MFDYVSQRLLFVSLQIAVFCGMLTGGNVISGRDNDFFPSRKHDFGTVARGSKTIHKFNIQNPFDQPLVISGVRSSCGCTRATIPEKVIAPGGIGFVLAEFNTRSFVGKKSATITVVLAEPTRREIQLRVTGNIR